MSVILLETLGGTPFDAMHKYAAGEGENILFRLLNWKRINLKREGRERAQKKMQIILTSHVQTINSWNI
jgi:hypothetical protein